jgi:hypothetical protein
MSTTLLTQDIWPQLTKIARGTRQPCAVAVAYFGAGASQLLPLPKNSRLVVDASERAIASGQTCPADLIKLVKRGVRAYSVPNLHAKVFVLGRAAYIGSANASNRSASHLVEAVVRTTETDTVRSARQFVRELCLHELTPAVLKHLAKLYRMKISTILDHIDSGHMALPEFQRGYVWNRDQVRGLFDSLYRGIRSAACWCGPRSPRPPRTAATARWRPAS